MALPPMWKVRREMWRVVGRLRVALMRLRGGRSRIVYEGLSVPLNRAGMNAEVVMALARKAYEKPEIQGLRRTVRPGDRILELGSGLGIVTALAARAAGPAGRVLSYEANPEMIPETLAFLAEHDIGNVDLRHAVLVPIAEPGETRTFHLAGSFASSSLLGADSRRARRTIKVPAVPLNEIVAAFRPDILICDIEGAEAELLPAFDASGLRAAVVELHPDRMSQAQLAGIGEALARHGLYPAKEIPGGTVVAYERVT